MDRRDPELGNGFHEIIKILLLSWPCDNNRCPCYERPATFPEGHMRTEISFLNNTVLRGELMCFLHPQQPVADCFVNIHCTLGRTETAGCIYDISQILAANITPGVPFWLHKQFR